MGACDSCQNFRAGDCLAQHAVIARYGEEPLQEWLAYSDKPNTCAYFKQRGPTAMDKRMVTKAMAELNTQQEVDSKAARETERLQRLKEYIQKTEADLLAAEAAEQLEQAARAQAEKDLANRVTDFKTKLKE